MEQLYDVVIVGGGPAGLTAALYLARARFRVVVLEKKAFGGQIVITHEVVNYPGIAKTDGRSLADTMRQQAEHFGAEFLLAEVRGFDLAGDVKTVRTDQGELRCLGVLLATGAQPRSVGFRGEAEYTGRGVAYCATCDGEFFTGKEVFVVGGGYAAAEESVFLTKFARHVTILVRKGDFSCAASVAQQAKEHEKITVLYHTQLEEVAGRGGLTYARYKNTATGEVTEYRSEEPFGVFVLAGYAPDTEVLRGVVALDEGGYILTDATQKTSREGVYAAGDVCIKPLRQVVTATADGALAATQLEKYVAAVQRRTGLRPQAPARKQEASAGGLSAEMRRQLEALFENMQEQLVLKLSLDDRPVSAELEQLVTDLGRITDKLTVTADGAAQDTPCVEVCRADGTPTGLAFHGVPGGHEFSSFVLGLYNAAGPGQPLEDADRARMEAIQEPVELQILVTLSCTLCPELVVAAQRIATVNPRVKAHVYDLRHFDALKERHGIMSVPCLVVNGERVFFGKKNLRELLQLLGV